MLRGGLEGGDNAVVVVVRVGGRLGEPDHLLGEDALAVDDGGDLPVAAAGVKADAAPVQVAANGLGAVLGLRQGLAGDHLEGTLKNICHVVPVKGLAPAGGVRLLQIGADVLAAPNVDFEAALHPQDGLDHPVDVVAVGLPHLRRAVDKRLAHGHLAVGALHGQAQGLLGVLEERLVELIQGQIIRVQLGAALDRDFDIQMLH